MAHQIYEATFTLESQDDLKLELDSEGAFIITVNANPPARLTMFDQTHLREIFTSFNAMWAEVEKLQRMYP